MIYLSILWHMHQPYYVNTSTGVINTPALIFRTLFNYYPMAVLSRMYPEVRVNFNLTPVLLSQIEGVSSGKFSDRFLALLEAGDSTTGEELLDFIDGLPPRVLKRYKVIDLLKEKIEEGTCKKQDLFDLKIYLHLASFHPLVFDDEIEALMEKGRNFGENDRELLHGKEKRILAEVIPLYRDLMDTGRIDISTSPLMHPVLPLLYNTDTARKTRTSLNIPEGLFSYPQDAREQLIAGMETYERIFKKPPAGIWPPEGGISDEVLELFSGQKILWTATDESLLAETLSHPLSQDERCSIWDFRGKLSIFFRDHSISDLVGFAYQRSDEKIAAADLADRLSNIAANAGKNILTIILDGENPWDFYPDYGENFLPAFYEALRGSNRIKTLPFSEALRTDISRRTLQGISPGSWMGTNFDNWIGKEPANRAWAILSKARAMAEKKQAGLTEEQKNALLETIMLAESSDWFWWYSLPAETKIKTRFDAFFRDSVRNIYEKIGEEAPEVLNLPLEEYAHEETTPYIKPVIDGKITHFYEWHDAVEIDPAALWATFKPVDIPVRKIFYGYDEDNFYMRLDFSEKADFEIRLTFHDSDRKVFTIYPGQQNTGTLIYACDRIIEIMIPRKEISAGDRDTIFFTVTIECKDGKQFVLPSGNFFRIRFAEEEEDWIM